MKEKKFYDIHCHAMNLSHPNFLAFLRRFESSVKDHKVKIFISANLVMTAYFLLHGLCPGLLKIILKKTGMAGIVNRGKNLLALMENDIGTFFQLVDDCVKEHVFKNGRMVIGGELYNKVVLTPLVMDFGYKNMINPKLHYFRQPVQKPVVEQVIDLFNGINNYFGTAESTVKVLEIYPFLGMNTSNYSFEQIKIMLEKYFSRYRGVEEDFFTNLGKFDGDIEQLTSNFFSGVKVYPPLGFDPWPENRVELKKVEFLYDYCCQKEIPITTHCSDGGFRVIDLEKALTYTSPDRWEKVLKKYGSLKLNFGHLGNGSHEKEWRKKILDLIDEYDHVYGDFSCRGFDDNYYLSLRKLLDSRGAKAPKLKGRVLFGSDFMINLLWMDSYCQYLGIYTGTPHLTSKEKNMFCADNPQRFLFKKSNSC